MTTSPLTFTTWHTTGVKTIEDARRRDLTVAASNKGAMTYTFPRMLNEFLGTRLKIVSGYQGNSTMVVAMERGEVNGVTNSWDSWKSLNPSWLTEKKINLLVQTEPKARDLDIPSVQELARNDEDRQVIALIVSGDALGKPLALAPNVPPERVTALRDAFDATVKDPEFIKRQESLGAVVVSDARVGQAEHKKFVEAEINKWGPVIKAAGQYAD